MLNCSAGFMNVDMTFDKPFYGIVYADYDRNSACKITGDGATSSNIRLPLKGCGTLQVSWLCIISIILFQKFFLAIMRKSLSCTIIHVFENSPPV